MRSPKLRPIPKPGTRSRKSTVAWSIVGLLCCIGALLAVVDPSLAGRSSGGSLTNDPHELTPTGDDGFVAPLPLNEQARSREIADAVAKAEEVDHASREAHADELIQKLIEKMRAERAARKAARTADGG